MTVMFAVNSSIPRWTALQWNAVVGVDAYGHGKRTWREMGYRVVTAARSSN